MQRHLDEEVSKRRPINLTIREDIIKDAKELNLNASKAAEYGIAQAIKKARGASMGWKKINSLYRLTTGE